VNQIRRGQGVPGSLAPQLPVRQAAEVLIHREHQPIEDGPIAASERGEEQRDVA
jgi:hypothetical protein